MVPCIETVQLRLAKDAKVNAIDSEGRTALIRILEDGTHLEGPSILQMAKVLLAAGADPTTLPHKPQPQYGTGATAPLTLALQKRDVPGLWMLLLEKLLVRGAGTNRRDKSGLTPLGLARTKDPAAMAPIIQLLQAASGVD